MSVGSEFEAESGGFGWPGLIPRAAPFLALILAGFLVVPLPRGDHAGPLLAAGGLLVLVIVGVAAAPWGRLPAWAQVLPMLAFLGVVALLRDAEGGSVSAESPLALVPVFWCSLYGTRRQLSVVIAGMALMFVAPRLVVGDPHYPVTEWERAFIWPLTGLLMGLTVQSLVARIKRQAALLKELAGTDALTGVPNRRTWDEALTREIERALRSREPLALVLLDLNGFKTYNDVHGHPAADRFLKETTSAWSAALRPTDTLARLGGDEFGLLLPGLGSVEAQAVVKRLEELMPTGQTFSAGLIETDGSERAEELFVRADAALYRRKTSRAGEGAGTGAKLNPS